MMKRYYLLLTIALTSLLANAQLTVQPLGSPMEMTRLIQEALLDSNIKVSNIVYKGNITAIGSFGGNSNIGINSGVLIASGAAARAVGPNNSPNAGSAWEMDGNNPNNDTDLAKLINLSKADLRDQAIVEFDFIAKSDTISFRYVFASEEYPEWVCAKFSDAFGFFISGPEPAGGSYVNKNLAVLPGTTLPINPNTVNSGKKGANTIPHEDCPAGGLANFHYYVDNDSGATVQYDGFTKPLTAMALVKCGAKYHIKLVIADVDDASFDSGLFIEKMHYNYSDCTSSITDAADMKPKQLQHIYNLLGQEVHITQTLNGGIFIYKYSDGSTLKVVKF